MFDKHDQELLDNLMGRLLELEAELQQEIASLSRVEQEAPDRISHQRLGRVNRALSKLRDGQRYGRCEQCDAPISHKQLCADPDCLLCADCLDQTSSH